MNPLSGIYGSGTKVSDIEWKLARSYLRIADALPDVHSNAMLSMRESSCTMCALPLGTPETTLFLLSSVPLYLWKLMAENCRLTFFS